MDQNSAESVIVLGDGAWGTTLALQVTRKGIPVGLWGVFPEYIQEMARTRYNRRFLPQVHIPPAVAFYTDIREALRDATVLICAIPTKYLRAVLQSFKTLPIQDQIIVSVTKGLEIGTLKRPSEIIYEETGNQHIVVLSGPSHAEEVALKKPASVVVASLNGILASRIQQLFMNEYFRVYTNTDIIGVEIGGALKNVIAVAVGIAEGMELGDNARAALMTRGLAEIARYGVACGARKETFAGLAGIGDLITTCVSSFGRNRHVGIQIGKGIPINDILSSMDAVAEGVSTAKAAYEFSCTHHIPMPITEQVYAIIYQQKKPIDALQDLMQRSAKPENEIPFEVE